MKKPKWEVVGGCIAMGKAEHAQQMVSMGKACCMCLRTGARLVKIAPIPGDRKLHDFMCESCAVEFLSEELTEVKSILGEVALAIRMTDAPEKAWLPLVAEAERRWGP